MRVYENKLRKDSMWDSSTAERSIENDWIVVTGNTDKSFFQVHQYEGSRDGHIVLIALDFKALTPLLKFEIFNDGSTRTLSLDNPNVNQTYRLLSYAKNTVEETRAVSIFRGTPTTSSSVGSKFAIRNVIKYDLTQIFGVGNEPTKAEVGQMEFLWTPAHADLTPEQIALMKYGEFEEAKQI